MANRPAWHIVDVQVKSEEFEFKWNGGFAVSQKRKNITALHDSIYNKYKEKVLEVSTKSEVELGNELSAFNLKLDGIYLENIFQSSKKYENGGPYLDLLDVAPKDAKRDERHKNSGKLISFVYENEEWDLLPKTCFYDYIYFKSIIENFGENLDLREYNWFTDIEFNPKKSLNCQARAITIYKLIQKLINENEILLKDLFVKDNFVNFHKKYVMN